MFVHQRSGKRSLLVCMIGEILIFFFYFFKFYAQVVILIQSIKPQLNKRSDRSGRSPRPAHTCDLSSKMVFHPRPTSASLEPILTLFLPLMLSSPLFLVICFSSLSVYFHGVLPEFQL